MLEYSFIPLLFCSKVTSGTVRATVRDAVLILPSFMIDGEPGACGFIHVFILAVRSVFTPGASCLLVFGPSCLALDAVDDLVQLRSWWVLSLVVER